MRNIYCLNKWMPFNPLLAESVEYLLEESSRSEVIDMSNSNAEYITDTNGVRLYTKLGFKKFKENNSSNFRTWSYNTNNNSGYDPFQVSYEFNYDPFNVKYDKKGAFD